MTGLFLWDHPVSPFAQKVRIALREKGISFQQATPNGVGSGNVAILNEGFREQNRRLQVPMLVDEDVRIFDSTIILEYIEDKYSEKPLRSTNFARRAKDRMIEDVCDTQYESINWGIGELRTFKRADGQLADKITERAKEQLEQIQAWLTQQLGEAEWFGVETFSYADVCVWPFVNRSISYGMPPEPGTPLRDWYERAKQRPSVNSVFKEFSEGVTGIAAAYEALQKGLIKREYRDHRLEWVIKSGGIEIVNDGLEKDNIRFQWPH